MAIAGDLNSTPQVISTNFFFFFFVLLIVLAAVVLKLNLDLLDRVQSMNS